MQEYDKWKTETQDRVLAESHHWTGALSKCQDKYERVLVKKDVEISFIVASKDTMIDSLRQDLQSLTQTLKDQKEDTECLLFAHRQSQ